MGAATANHPVQVRATSCATRGVATATALLGAAVWVVSVVFVVVSVPGEQSAARGAVHAVVVGVPFIAGIYAIQVPRQTRFGVLLLASGLAWSLTALGQSPESVPYSIGRVAAWLVFPTVIYLALAFPQGHLARGVDRWLFGALNVVLVALFIASALFVEAYPEHTPWAACLADCPANAFMVVATEPAVIASVVEPVREALAVLLFAGALVSLALRWRAATPLQRSAAWPVMFAIGVSIVILAAFFAARRNPDWTSAADTLGLFWALSVAGIAAAFLIGLLRRRLLLGHVLARLAERLSSELELVRVRDALASALGDPTLDLLVPDGPVRWLDAHGRPAVLPSAASGRDVTVIDENGDPVVALVHDPQLRTDDELLTAVSALLLGTMTRFRITTRLGGTLLALAQSRRRIAEAAVHERARIERDLHDGAQQRLMMLRIRISLAEELLQTDPEAGARAVRALGAEVDDTLDELRALAHGVYPAILNDRGLEQAVRSLAIAAPIAIHVQASGLTRHSTEIENAVYFTCAEAIQNAIKHATGASGLWITLRQERGLMLEVLDDGPGFTPPLPNQAVPGQDGLRNMRDRLEAVGGRVTVDASPGHGTRVVGFVPSE